jgi:sugar phosphate isomerase/epimerase
MQIGIFTRVYKRATLADVLDAVRAAGVTAVQFNMECAGLPELPEEITPEAAATIGAALRERGIAMAAVSGTFNIIHPDAVQRQAGMRGLRALAAACPALGTQVITLSTGTRNAAHMWRTHPENDTPEAWEESAAALRDIAAIGEEYGVTMAFEPEVSNIVDSAQKARHMLDTVGSPSLKVVMDGANLFHEGELPRMAEILDDAMSPARRRHRAGACQGSRPRRRCGQPAGRAWGARLRPLSAATARCGVYRRSRAPRPRRRAGGGMYGVSCGAPECAAVTVITAEDAEERRGVED